MESMESALSLLILSGLQVETVAALSIVVFGNVLPLGLIAWMFWYAARRPEVLSPRPVQSRGVKKLRHAA